MRYTSNHSGFKPGPKHYDNSNGSYYRKRMFDGSGFSDKRKNEGVRGNTNFNYPTGNKYSGGGMFRSRQDRSSSRRRHSRSRSRSRSRSQSSNKRSHSNSNPKINNNFE